jgi:hypothetical protein
VSTPREDFGRPTDSARALDRTCRRSSASAGPVPVQVPGQCLARTTACADAGATERRF